MGVLWKWTSYKTFAQSICLCSGHYLTRTPTFWAFSCPATVPTFPVSHTQTTCRVTSASSSCTGRASPCSVACVNLCSKFVLMRQAFSCAIALPTWKSYFRLHFLVYYYLCPTIVAITLLEVIRKLKFGTTLRTNSGNQSNHTDRCVRFSLRVLQDESFYAACAHHTGRPRVPQKNISLKRIYLYNLTEPL